LDSLDFDDDVHAPLAVAKPPGKWPVFAVFGLSAAGVMAVGIFKAYKPALITYGILLIVGCFLLYWQRHTAIAATRRAGGIGYVELSGLERLALLALVLACLANGLVIALEVASWNWGA